MPRKIGTRLGRTLLTNGRREKILAQRLVDRLGLPIDGRILAAVVALRTNGFQTSASCEGHLSRGEPVPWIDFGVIAQNDLSSIDREGLNRKNLLSQKRLLEFLDNFYKEYDSEAGDRLIIVPVGIFGGFRLTNQAGAVQRLLSTRVKRNNLLRFQREFDLFSHFLHLHAESHGVRSNPLKHTT